MVPVRIGKFANFTAWLEVKRSFPLRIAQRMCYTQRADVRIQEVDGETLVLDDENGYIHQLNDTASFVWQQCDGKSSTEEIVRRLAKEFDVDDAVAAKDVSEVIEKLRRIAASK